MYIWLSFIIIQILYYKDARIILYPFWIWVYFSLTLAPHTTGYNYQSCYQIDKIEQFIGSMVHLPPPSISVQIKFEFRQTVTNEDNSCIYCYFVN